MAVTKALTVNNFLEADPASALFVRLGHDGHPTQMTARDWAAALDDFRLGDDVPEDVRDLYATAVGCLFYGFFYYPLYALGGEQLFRVCEAAARARCVALGCPQKTFAAAIRLLHESGTLSDKERDRRDTFRRLRNAGSHPEFQTLNVPGAITGMAARISTAIESLFAEPRSSGEERA